MEEQVLWNMPSLEFVEGLYIWVAGTKNPSELEYFWLDTLGSH